MVRGLRPHSRAALSTVAPQARVRSNFSSAFFLALVGMAVLLWFRWRFGRFWQTLSCFSGSPLAFRADFSGFLHDGESDTDSVGAAGQSLGLLAREVLEALHDHVAVQGIDFHQEGLAARLLGGDQGAS